MNFALDDRGRELTAAGAALGARCRSQTPAQVGEDWRVAGAKELLRAVGVEGLALFLDAYVSARGSIRAARVHAADAIARAPSVAEAVILAAGVEALVAEVVENVRLRADTRPADFPDEKDPAVRRALADARALSLIARNMALRAGFVVDAGSPTSDVQTAPAIALSSACDAVLTAWPALSRLVLVEETYQRFESDLFRVAAKTKPIVRAAIATSLVGPATTSSETTVTADRSGRVS